MRLVAREFTRIFPTPSSRKDARPKPLQEYLNSAAIVVLGEPGAGKTTSFTEAAATEQNGRFVSVRDFLALSPERWRGKILYLDGLDEQRAKSRDGTAVLDQLRTRLDELGCPRFRLSCRAADWYGSSDVERLRLVSSDGSLTVLRLKSLSDDDVRAIVEDMVPEFPQFIEEADRRGIRDLLGNPQTLKMILEVVREGGLPSTRSELYQRASEILARETNEEYGRIEAPRINSRRVLQAAAGICAIQLCTGVRGVALTSVDANEDFPFIGELPGDMTDLSAATRRRLFVGDGSGRVAPIHRTVAEYLAARYLGDLVREGLPIGRILALLTGYDGGSLSDLRGLFAWFASTCLESAETLIARDPLGIVLYGDVSVLPTGMKRALIEHLARLAEKNPWFRAGNWVSQPFGDLASPDMEPVFRRILDENSQHPVFVSCVLDAIRYGQPLPGLGQSLLKIVRDEGRAEFVRVGALRAFQHVTSEAPDELERLLKDIHSGRIRDDNRQLRGQLLGTLYPSPITPAEVTHYLVQPSPHLIGAYTMFVEYELLDMTSSEDLPSLLDAVANHEVLRSSGEWQRFSGGLLARGVSELGERVPAARLFAWLAIGLDEYGHVKIDDEDSQSVRQWFVAHDMLMRDLFVHWLSVTPADRLRYESYGLQERFYRAPFGPGFSRWMLERAVSERDAQRADFLFREAIRRGMADVEEAGLTVDEMYDCVDRHPVFRDALLSEVSWEIPAWRIESAERAAERQRRTSKARAARIQELAPYMRKIKEGVAIGPLSFLAQVYFGLFVDVDRDRQPGERLADMTSDETAGAALEGFVASLSRPQTLPSSRQIGEAHAQAEQYRFGYAVLAGVDILAQRSMGDVLAVPEASLMIALVFHYANTTGHERPWVKALMVDRPESVARTLEEFWLPHVSRKVGYVPGIYDLDSDGGSGVARHLVVKLLRAFPRCPEDTFRALVGAALHRVDAGAVAEVAREVLGRKRSVTGKNRTQWLGIGFLLAPEEFQTRAVKHVEGRKERIRELLGFALSGETGSWEYARGLPTSLVARLIEIGGKSFPPREMEAGFGAVSPDWEMARKVQGLIDLLSNRVGRESTEALLSLHRISRLGSWREALAHAIAVQARTRRDAEFGYASIGEVVQTLSGGAPANAVDLQALVVAELRTLREELRHGLTDGYKALWNVDSYGRVSKPRPEEDCRDRLLEHLRPRLLRSRVVAEPEGHYAEDKRADIKAIALDLNVPVEIKRHYHKDLWTAPREQLGRLYARDPGTAGRGVYLVLWFGEEVGPIQDPPQGLDRPDGPETLELALSKVIPEQDDLVIEFVVLDCSKARQSPTVSS